MEAPDSDCTPPAVQFVGLGTRLGTYLICASYLCLMIRHFRSPFSSFLHRLYRLADAAWLLNAVLLVCIFSVGVLHPLHTTTCRNPQTSRTPSPHLQPWPIQTSLGHCPGFRSITATEYITISHMFALNAAIIAQGRMVGWSQEPAFPTSEYYLLQCGKELAMTGSYIARTVLAWWFWVSLYDDMHCHGAHSPVYAFFFARVRLPCHMRLLSPTIVCN